jgi:hypothetical protein
VFGLEVFYVQITKQERRILNEKKKAFKSDCVRAGVVFFGVFVSVEYFWVT